MIEHVKNPSRTSLISKDAIETLKEVKYSWYLLMVFMVFNCMFN